MAEKSPLQKLLEDVKNRFKFHPATETTGPQHDAVRADLGRLALKIAKTLPMSREQSLALTHLEEAMFWANAAIARHAESPAAGETPPPSGRTSTKRVPAKRTAKKTSSRRVTRRRAEPPI